MGLIRATPARFVDRWEEDGGVTAFAFRPDRPFPHIAGSHAIFFLPQGGRKPFTIASAPEEGDLVLATTLASGSRFKRSLGALTPGDRIKMRGPIASFTLRGSAPEVLFIAQGVGVTPFRSLLRHLSAGGAAKDTTLVHVAPAHAFRAETEQLATRSCYPTDAEQFRLELKQAAHERPDATCFLSGAPAFVAATATLLTDLGIPRRQLRQDKFRGY